MSISNMLDSLKLVVKTTPSFEIFGGLVIGKSGRGTRLDYNHLYVFGKSLHQQEYKVLKKGLGVGLSKEQVSNLFNSRYVQRICLL